MITADGGGVGLQLGGMGIGITGDYVGIGRADNDHDFAVGIIPGSDNDCHKCSDRHHRRHHRHHCASCDAGE